MEKTLYSGVAPPARAPSSIMIVEDEAIVAMDLAQQLEDLGYRIGAIVDNGRDAIATANEIHPDLVLMDIVIKGDMDGIEAARHIGRLQHTPIIFLTAYSDRPTVERAVHSAPYGYLTKPFQIREVRAAIEVAIYKAGLERQLRESEQWFAATLRCVADGVIATDPTARVRFMNPVAENLTGWPLDEALGRAIEEIAEVADADGGHWPDSPVRRALQDESPAGIHFASTLTTRSGQRVPVDDSAAPIHAEDGRLLGAVLAFRDVSARLRAEESLRASEDRFRTVFDMAPVGMALIGLSGELLQLNNAMCRLLQRDMSALIGARQQELTDPEDIVPERNAQISLLTGDARTVQFEKRMLRADGSRLCVLVSASLLRHQEEPFCYLYQIHDLTERKASESELARLAHFDTLTGLANRAKLRQQTEDMIASARRHHRRLAVLFIDIDHFKQINDSAGHEAGDRFLQLFSDRLRGIVRDIDCVARIGGDEFVIVLPELQGADGVVRVLDKLRHACQEPFRMPGTELNTTVSVGVALYPDDGEDSATLFRNADSALYHAKAEGRNNTQFYRRELTARLEQRLDVERKLRRALAKSEFELHYQPVISLADDRVVGAEVLIRWLDPELGLVGPEYFIPVAEETGLIVPIGDWVLQEACREAASWATEDGFSIAVNLSARQFRSGTLSQSVSDALLRSGFDATRLCLEITEQLLLGDSEQNLQTIDRLKDIGTTISIDDFGTGYSSLSYIKRFGPRMLKIDRSFVSELADSADDAAIVKTIIAMARALKLKVVAEGVETEVQRDFLRAAGCDFAQGYLYAPGLPAEEFRRWLRSRS